MLDNQTVGVVVRLEKEALQVLDMHGRVVRVKSQAVHGKRNSKFAIALDSEQNPISVRACSPYERSTICIFSAATQCALLMDRMHRLEAARPPAKYDTSFGAFIKASTKLLHLIFHPLQFLRVSLLAYTP